VNRRIVNTKPWPRPAQFGPVDGSVRRTVVCYTRSTKDDDHSKRHKRKPMLKELIEKANHEINERPLVAIDCALDAFSTAELGADKASLMVLLNLFCRAVLRCINRGDGSQQSSPCIDLFSKETSQENRRFVAICLLRLLPRNRNVLSSIDFALNVFAIFDDVLARDFYPPLGLDTKDQNYKKAGELGAIVPRVENEVAEVINSLNSLDVLSSFRKTFMKTINRLPNGAVLLPFISRKLLGPRLDELFSTVEAYLGAAGPALLAAFKKAIETLAAFRLEADRHGSLYDREYLAGLATRIHYLVRKRFEESAISKSATLTAAKSEKKYPFHIEGKHFSVSFVVKNEGPGHAFDAYFQVSEVTDLEVKKAETYLGDLEPTSVIVEVPVICTRPAEDVVAAIELRWSDFDKTPHSAQFLLGLDRQRPDVDWESLSVAESYSLEPVETEAELVGRKEILELLLAQARAKSLGSSYIFGQKRVGKTSIVKTLKTHLHTVCPANFLVLYFGRGDYAGPDATSTVARLGKRICQAITRTDPRFTTMAAFRVMR